MESERDPEIILTPRQREVLQCLRQGLTNEEIARQLGVTLDGVKFHVSEILGRLGVSSRYEAASWPAHPDRGRRELVLAPFGFLRRDVLGVGTRVLAGAVIALAVAGIALLAWGVLSARDDSASVPVAVVSPQFLPEPSIIRGDGWTFETRVSNLPSLDLALAVEANPYPGLRTTLIDVPSGRAVAVGEFGSNPLVRLRQAPLQLVVSDVAPATHASGGGYRLLVLDLGGADPTMRLNVPLPDRYGYQQYYDTMYLSPDGRRAYVPEHVRHGTALCDNTNLSNFPCFDDVIGIVDLDTGNVTRAPLPEHCLPYSIAPLKRGGAAVACEQGSPTGAVTLLALAVGDDGRATAPVGVPPYSYNTSVPYATASGDRAPLVLKGDGTVWSSADNRLRSGLLKPGQEVIDTRQIDDDRVLVLAGPSQPTIGVHITDAFVIDLVHARVVSSAGLPAGYADATVLDDQRAVVLVKDGSQFETMQLDLKTGVLGAPVTLQGLPGAPDHIVD